MLKKMGHSAELANNGHEAVEMFSKDTFDLILMDIQMPMMDGFTATHKIREMESRSGSRVPIIAMTAHAMKGYEQRCLDAGMDGYVAKPATSHQLESAIARLAVKASVTDESLDCATVNPWNPERARERIGGDDTLLCEIIELFLEENPKQLAALNQALSQADAASVERIAHSLKGELGCLEVIEAGRHARVLEEQARVGRLEGAARLLQLLENEISAAAKAMCNFRDAARGSGTPIALKASQS